MDDVMQYSKGLTVLYQRYLDHCAEINYPALPRWRFEQEIESEIQKLMEQSDGSRWMDVRQVAS